MNNKSYEDVDAVGCCDYRDIQEQERASVQVINL